MRAKRLEYRGRGVYYRVKNCMNFRIFETQGTFCGKEVSDICRHMSATWSLDETCYHDYDIVLSCLEMVDGVRNVRERTFI